MPFAVWLLLLRNRNFFNFSCRGAQSSWLIVGAVYWGNNLRLPLVALLKNIPAKLVQKTLIKFWIPGAFNLHGTLLSGLAAELVTFLAVATLIMDPLLIRLKRMLPAQGYFLSPRKGKTYLPRQGWA